MAHSKWIVRSTFLSQDSFQKPFDFNQALDVQMMYRFWMKAGKFSYYQWFIPVHIVTGAPKADSWECKATDYL